MVLLLSVAVALTVSGCAAESARDAALPVLLEEREYVSSQADVAAQTADVAEAQDVLIARSRLGMILPPSIHDWPLDGPSFSGIVGVSTSGTEVTGTFVIFGRGQSGSGDLYDDVRLYTCVEVVVDVASSSADVASVPCPRDVETQLEENPRFIRVTDPSAVDLPRRPVPLVRVLPGTASSETRASRCAGVITSWSG